MKRRDMHFLQPIVVVTSLLAVGCQAGAVTSAPAARRNSPAQITSSVLAPAPLPPNVSCFWSGTAEPAGDLLVPAAPSTLVNIEVTNSTAVQLVEKFDVFVSDSRLPPGGPDAVTRPSDVPNLVWQLGAGPLSVTVPPGKTVSTSVDWSARAPDGSVPPAGIYGGWAIGSDITGTINDRCESALRIP